METEQNVDIHPQFQETDSPSLSLVSYTSVTYVKQFSQQGEGTVVLSHLVTRVLFALLVLTPSSHLASWSYVCSRRQKWLDRIMRRSIQEQSNTETRKHFNVIMCALAVMCFMN